MRLDSSGNLGLGVTPSTAWGASNSQKAFQLGPVGALSSLDAGAGNKQFNLSSNAINFNSTPTYLLSDFAAAYRMVGSAHQWYTAPSGTAGNAISFTQAMTLDASGNLGVGTTSPRYRLHLAKTAGAEFTLSDVDGGGPTQGRALTLKSPTAGRAGYVGTETGHDLAFYTGDTERARITSGGDLLVGTTSASLIGGRGSKVNAVQNTDGLWAGGFVHTASGAQEPFGIGVLYSNRAPNNAQNPFLYLEDNAALRTEIRSNGGIANYQANDVNLSDRREKTNFAPAKDYLDTICAIPVQTFNYIDQSADDPGLTLGVVAQDVQAVAPELVMESNWGTEDKPKMRLSIYQTDLQYALMKCIQELKAQNDDLRARVAALEA
jgi:hypothetical protein